MLDQQAPASDRDKHLAVEIFCRLKKGFLLFLFLLTCTIASPLYAAIITWDGGGGDNNWDTCANWDNADTCPGTADVATFNGTSSKAATINVAVDVAGIDIQAGYLATITQGAGNTLTVGTSNFNQAGGTFTGGDSTIDSDGTFTLSGGTFTSTSGNWRQSGNLTLSGGTFNHNSGNLTLFRDSKTVNTGTAQFYNVLIDISNTNTLTISGTFDINGNLTVSNVGRVNGGVITIAGDLIATDSSSTPGGSVTYRLDGNAAQTLMVDDVGGSGALASIDIAQGVSGTLLIKDNIIIDGQDDWIYTSSSNVDAGTSTVTFGVLGLSVNSGPMTFNNVALTMNSNTLTVIGTMDVNGNLTINSTSGIAGGTIAVAGDVITLDSTVINNGTILFDGGLDQSLSAGGGVGELPHVLISKSGGTLTITDTIKVYRSWTYTPGATVDASTSTIIFDFFGKSIMATGMAFNDVDIQLSGNNFTVIGTMDIDGDLTITSTGTIDGGNITLAGDLTSMDSSVNGATPITLDGTGTQNISIAGNDLPNGLFEIDKTLGSAVLTSAMTTALNGPGQDLTITQGTLDLNGFNLTVPDALTVSASGTLQLEGDEVVSTTTTTLNTGSTVLYDGAGAYTGLQMGDLYSNLSFNSSGSWTLNSALDVDNHFTLTSGTVDVNNIGNYQLNVAGNWNNSGTFTARAGTVILDGSNQAVNGSTTFYNLTKSIVAADTLTFQAGQTTSIASGGIATLNGSSGQLLSLVSNTAGTHWHFNLANGAFRSIDYISVVDADAAGSDATHKPVNPTNATDGGNNIDWFYEMSGRVFEDVNYSGGSGSAYQGGTDAGIPNVTVELYDTVGPNLIDTTSTDASGDYTLTPASAGNHIVRVVSSTLGDSDSPPAAGLNGVVTAIAEQTYEHNGIGGNGDAGAMGGNDVDIDDTATAAAAGIGDTNVNVAVGGATIVVAGVDLGFSYQLIVNEQDVGQGSLRQFITNANNITGVNSSQFMIPATKLDLNGVATISPASALPSINDATGGTTVNATTQTTNIGDNNGSGPEVEISGGGAPPYDGFNITSANNTIRGFVINGYNGSNMGAVNINGASATNNIIVGNYLGTNYSATAVVSNASGIRIAGGAQTNTIGGTGGAATRNIISGGSLTGIYISGVGTDANEIKGNYIGTDANGTSALPNNGHGIDISASAANNIIGGTVAGAANVIAYNGDGAGEYGIYVNSAGADGNIISANAIFGNFDQGIKLAGDGANNNQAPPTITAISPNGANFDVTATLTANDTLEFFRVNNGAAPLVVADGSGAGEGFLYLGACSDNGGACSGPHISGADAIAGDATITVSLLSSGITSADLISATTTAATNGTSEFANNATIPNVTTISGTVYTDEATTLIGNGAVIRLIVNGISAGTAITSGGTGTYAINASLSVNDRILVYIDGFTSDGTTMTVSNGAHLAGLDIYGDHVIVRNDNGVATTNADMDIALGLLADTEILYDVDGSNNLTLEGVGTQFYLPVGHSFAANGAVNAHDIQINGALTAGANAITLNGSWHNNGIFTANTATVIFNATTGTALIDSSGATTADFYNITFNDGGGTTTWQLESPLGVSNDLTMTDGILDTRSGTNHNINVTRHFTQTAGQVHARSSTLTVGGDFISDGAEDSTGLNDADLILIGAGILSYNNLTTPWLNGVNNLTVGQTGNVTTLMTPLVVREIMTVGSGTLTGTQELFLAGENPLSFDANSIVSLNALNFYRNTTAQNIIALANGYDSDIIVSRDGGVLNQLNNIVINSVHQLRIDGDGNDSRTVTYNTNGFDLVVGGDIILGAGNDTSLKTFNGTNSTISVAGNFNIRAIGSGSQQAIFTATNSTVMLNGTTNQTITSSGNNFNHLTLNNSGTVGNDNITISGALDVDGNLTIIVGTLDVTASNYALNVAGNWSNNDTFTPQSGSVTLDGSNQSITGSTTFYNLIKSVAAADTLSFNAGDTFTVNGALNFTGASSQLLSLVSSIPTSAWFLNMGIGTQTVDYVSAQDSDASGGAMIVPVIAQSLDLGRNVNWAFSSAVNSVIGEISPNEVAVSTVGQSFTYDLLPTIGGSDSGVDTVTINTPVGYTNLTVSGVRVNAAVQALSGACPTVGAGEYCASLSGQVMTITLGTKVTTTLQPIEVSFMADTPATPGSGSFISTIDDSATLSIPAQTVSMGDADGDAMDNNSQTVTIEGPAVTTAVAEISPNNVGLSMVGNLFSTDILTTIQGADSGVNQVSITAPTGYANLALSAVSVNSIVQNPGSSCPTVAADEYCTTLAGQVMTITLGSPQNSSGVIHVEFSADAPSVTGSASFNVTVDDSTTLTMGAQNATVGNADADAADNNSLDVSIVSLNNAITSLIGEVTPNTAGSNSAATPFSFYLRPTISGSDSGLNQATITMPPGYANINVTATSVDGTPLIASALCPTVNAGEYCATISGQDIILDLGTTITTSLAAIKIDFTSDTPNSVGTTSLSYTVDDTATGLIPPQNGIAGNADGNAANSNSLDIVLVSVDPSLSTATLSPEIIIADGASTGVITVRLLDSSGNPVSGKSIIISSDRGTTDTITQPIAVTDINGIAQGTISSSTFGTATFTVINTTDTITLLSQPQAHFTQGQVLTLTKTANKNDVVVGDLITYTIEVKNSTIQPVQQVKLEDITPDNFKYRAGSALFNGAPALDPAGDRTLTFNVGTIPALIDTNGNGEADPGETGYSRVDYQLIVGAGATPGAYTNTIVAKDSCHLCTISNNATANVEVALDPLFDLGTIIGKVFHDKNGDNTQDQGEEGIAGAMVVLDEGTYVTTDSHGRFHFPAVTPGERLLKINLTSLPSGTSLNDNETQVASVTPGLLTKANFGVLQSLIAKKIGRPGIKGLMVSINEKPKVVSLVGNTELQTIIVNGSQVRIPQAKAHLHVNEMPSEVLNFNGKKLAYPALFHTEVSRPNEVTTWKLRIMTPEGKSVYDFDGSSAPPDIIKWDGYDNNQTQTKGGSLYHYQLTVNYNNGAYATSARRLIGVDHKSVIELNLSGGSFKTGNFALNDDAKNMLKEAAETLRRFPRERVVIEGHSDSSGDDKVNLDLSQKRAEAAHAYLVGVEKISPIRLKIRWYGEDRPIATNDSNEGRLLNRRVAMKGLISDVIRAKRRHRFQNQSIAKINGKEISLDHLGRFSLPIQEQNFLIAMSNKHGQSTSTQITRPTLVITQPENKALIPYTSNTHSASQNESLSTTIETSNALSISSTRHYKLIGKTDPGSLVQIESTKIPVSSNGTFEHPLILNDGMQTLQVVVYGPQGFTYITKLQIEARTQTKDKQPFYLQAPIPTLQLDLPPSGITIQTGNYTLSGKTSPDNIVFINNQSVTVEPDGRFTHTISLKLGKNTVLVKTIDPGGYSGTLDHTIDAGKPQLFFMAFADGKFSQLNTKGYIQGSGKNSESELYSEGRLAFYLKGKIKGKYLITAALDTGQGELSTLFKDFDDDGTKALLKNLDPDHYYPVYGDNSTLVYDTQSQGKFYLAIDSDTIHSVVGNYKLNLSDNELAAYRRTLYGGLFEYHSLSRSKYGKHNTIIRLFGAQTRQSHVLDELRATGGSLYYLSQRDIIEGSEQVTLVVKDKNTGLTLSRQPQQQGTNYSIKYPGGRLLFNRPVSSTEQDNRLINSALLSGNPIYIEVDYEYHTASFEKTANGAHVQQQLGEHVTIGATHVEDELSAGTYKLQGVNSEIRVMKNSRIIAEVAESSGSEGQVFTSNDGGLLFSPITNNHQSGQASKITAEIDLGEFIGSPNRVKVGAYVKEVEPGFQANGSSSEQGKKKQGANVMVHVSKRNTFKLRHDQEQSTAITPADSVDASQQSTAQWRYEAPRWALTGEYYDQQAEDRIGTELNRGSLAATELKSFITDKLEARISHQSTLEGEANDQSTIGLKYHLTKNLHIAGTATSGDKGDAGEARIDYHSKQVNIYLTERVNDDKSGKTTSTIFGGETAIATIAGADSSKIYSEYQWDNGDTSDRSLSLVGAEQQWLIENGLKFNLNSEYSDISANNGTISRSTVAIGISYKKSGFKISTRNEIRNDRGDERKKQLLTSNSFEYNLNPDYTAIGKYRHSTTQNLTTNSDDAKFDEHSIGLAYRPTHHDKLNALTRYTRLSDSSPLNLSNSTATATEMKVFSIEWSYQITKKLEWSEKQAIRFKTEKNVGFEPFKSKTHLSIHRLNYTLPWWQLRFGTEYRTLKQKEANDQRVGWLTELTWEANKHMRLGGGYNFTDFSDNEFSSNDYSSEGWFIRLQGKY